MQKNGPPRERQAGVDSKDVGAAFGYIGEDKAPVLAIQPWQVLKLSEWYGIPYSTALVITELSGFGPEGGAA